MVTDTEMRQLNFTTEQHWHGTFMLLIEAKVRKFILLKFIYIKAKAIAISLQMGS